jgi:hypothetical protein
MKTTSAERMRETRARRRCGVVHVSIKLTADEVRRIEELGYLQKGERGKEALTEAVELFVSDLAWV